MNPSQVARAVAAATSTAISLDLAVEDIVVLHDSNKLTLRMLPCDLVARVAPISHHGSRFELDLAHHLAAAGCPVATVDPRAGPHVHISDDYEITLWTFYESAPSGAIPSVDFAAALGQLHTGMRELEVATPHFTDRVESAQQLVASRERAPALTDDDRELLGDTLHGLTRRIAGHGREQVLHGEPHPGNVLATTHGLVFIDFETCCRGPVEFDVAHAPEDVALHYPGLDHDLLRECRKLALAMVTAWRWDREDQLPNGQQIGVSQLSQIRGWTS